MMSLEELPCKRSRVSGYTQDPALLHHASTSPPRLIVEAPYLGSNLSNGRSEIARDTIVCFGMVSPRPIRLLAFTNLYSL